MAWCERSCGRKANPGNRLCVHCADRQSARNHDRGKPDPLRQKRAQVGWRYAEVNQAIEQLKNRWAR